MQCCAFCHQAGDGVCQVGVCSNRCEVWAHSECFDARFRSAEWRKKHAHRGGREAEMCPNASCAGKFRRKMARAMPQGEEDERRVPETVSSATKKRQDECAPCAFLGRDGTPCRRAAVAHGACRLHARDALLLDAMVRKQDTHDASTQTTQPSHDASTQTTDDDELARARATIDDLACELSALRAAYLGVSDRAQALAARYA